MPSVNRPQGAVFFIGYLPSYPFKGGLGVKYMASDFFDPNTQIVDEPKNESISVVEKIKVGETEYSQEELNKLVGLGKIGLEAEEKFKTPIDKVWPTTQRVINENKELRDRVDSYEKAKVQEKVNQGQQLTAEETAAQVRAELKKYGVVFEDEFPAKSQEIFVRNQQASEILKDTRNAVEKYKNDYGVDTTDERVLEYMKDTGVTKPEVALKLMFEDKIDQVKEQKLKGIRPQGMVTSQTSQAGGKVPEPVKVSKDNLESLVHEFVQNSQE